MASDAVWAEAERRFPENEPAYADRGMVSPEVREQREAFEEGWEAATQAFERRVAAMLRAFDYWNANRGKDADRDEEMFRAFLATLAPLRALSASTGKENG